MDSGSTQERQQAHALLDLLSPEKLTAVRALLQVMVEPLSKSLSSAPLDEEDLTTETVNSLERARKSLEQGEGIPHGSLLREFGLDK